MFCMRIKCTFQYCEFNSIELNITETKFYQNRNQFHKIKTSDFLEQNSHLSLSLTETTLKNILELNTKYTLCIIKITYPLPKNILGAS